MAVELLTNGSMEADANWSSIGTPVSNTQSATQKHAGSFSRKLVANSAGDGFESDVIATTSGVYYVSIAWLYGDGVNAIALRMSRAGEDLYFPRTASGGGFIPAVGWVRHVFYWTATVTDSLYQLQLLGDTGVTAGTHYLDDASVTAMGDVDPKGLSKLRENLTLA